MKQTIMPECNCKAFNHFFEFQHKQRKNITCTDKGSRTKYIYPNNDFDFLSKYRVDGGLIADDGYKCDYLLLNCNKLHSYFIEIKGSDLIRAIEQIDRSIDLLKPLIADFSVFARIVLTRVNTPDLKTVKYLQLEKKIKALQGNLKQQTQVMNEKTAWLCAP